MYVLVESRSSAWRRSSGFGEISSPFMYLGHWPYCEFQPSQKQSRNLLLKTSGSSVTVEWGLLLNVRQFNGASCLWLVLSISVAWENSKWHKDNSKFSDIFMNIFFPIYNKHWEKRARHSIYFVYRWCSMCLWLSGALHYLWGPLEGLPCWEHSPRLSLGSNNFW